MENEHIPNMYGGALYRDKERAQKPTLPTKEKMAGRVIGGLKAQNAHMKTVEIDGELHSFPRAEYVEQLENQVKDARKKLADLEAKTNRLIKANNRMMNKLREIDRELANKIDYK